MKKIISIFLAVIMAFSISVVAFAAENRAVKLGETVTVNINKGDPEETYSFTADEQGIYVLKTKINSFGPFGLSINHNSQFIEKTYVLLNSYFSGYQYDEAYFCAEKDSTFEISNYFGIDKPKYPLNAEFTIEKYDAPTAKIGSNEVKQGGSYFLFVPENSGKYNFRSTAPDTIDPKIEVYDENGLVGENDNNGYKDDDNFDLTLTLEKGRIYGIKCETDNGYNFTISYNAEINPDEIVINDGRVIQLLKGQQYVASVEIIPSGSLPYANYTVKSSNESVASVTVNDDGDLVITSHKKGVAEITLTDESGVSSKCLVLVVPKWMKVAEGVAIWSVINSVFTFFFVLIYGGLIVIAWIKSLK